VGAPAEGCECKASGELGIALSGGGARALAQLGVLSVLDREGIPVSYVAGTSAGAIVGATYVTSRDAAEATERLREHLATTGVGFNVETFANLKARGSREGLWGVATGLWRVARHDVLIGGAKMRDSLGVLLGTASFSDVRLPFATTALDLITGRRMIFAAGDLVDAVYASSAVPGLFEPLEMGGYVLVDGGWAEPVPVATCHHLGAIHIIAVDVPSVDSYERDSHAVSAALRADALARDLLEEEQSRQADFIIRVGARVRHFADFENVEGLIAAGKKAAEEALGDIRAVLERHRALFVRVPSTGKHVEGCH
jgi:NTE family protein